MLSVSAKRITWLSALVLFAVSVAECGMCCCVQARLRLLPQGGVAGDSCCSADGARTTEEPADGACQCCWSLPPGNRADVRLATGDLPLWSTSAPSVTVPVSPCAAGTVSVIENAVRWFGNRRQSVLCVWRN